jgi:hypothetical protein
VALVVLSGLALAQTEEPFYGSGTFTPTSVKVGNCFDSAQYTAAGEGTPLGQFEGDGHQRVDYCGIGPDMEGDVTLTAENGDQISLHYVGKRLDPSTYLCTLVVTGGTGRYDGATVDATLLIENYNLSEPFDITMDGTIQYP